MARPEPFAEANGTLLPPPGEEDSVLPLPVRRIDGAIVSCWRLSPAEVAEILRTGVVWLEVLGRTSAPPVMVTAFKRDVI